MKGGQPMPKLESRSEGTGTLASVILQSAQRWPNIESIVMPSVRWSFQTLAERMFSVAGALRAAGLRRGDRIGLLMEDSSTYLEVMLGAVLLGVVPVLFNEVTRGDHLRFLIGALGLKMLFASRSERMDFVHLAHELQGHAPASSDKSGVASGIVMVQVGPDSGEDSTYGGFIAGGAAVPQRDIAEQADAIKSGDSLVILFTSAVTTGVPKTCALSNLDVLDNVRPFTERIKLSEGARIWIPLHMFQVGFFAPLAAALSAGATLVAAERFDAVATLQMLRQERITHAYPVYPSYWLPVIYHLDFFPSDFAALTHIVLLGPIALLRRAQRSLPQSSVMNTYGGAEAGGAICMPFDNDPSDIRLGSIGRPYPGHEMRIVDPGTGHVCGLGEVGEIQIRRRGVFAAHHEFGSLYTHDGWLQTSDLGSIAPDGVVYYYGRLSEMLNIAGRNISATSVEAVLSEHPAVSVAQVIAVSDPEMGQVAAAFVELRPGYFSDASELLEYCRTRMSETQIPRSITFVTDWPMSASKIQKPRLAKLIEQAGPADRASM